MTGDREWRLHAACKTVPTENFFPERADTPAHMRNLRALCHSCPVRAECAAYAVDNHIPHGFWGGLSENQRRQIWHQQTIAARRQQQTTKAS